MLHSGEMFAGYRIERVLGAGGMGEVYVARHPRLPRSDAVMVLPAQYAADPEYRARFEREADLVASLSHPAIVKVYDRGEYEGRLWIAMELVDGVDLAQRLSVTGPFAIDEVIRIAETVAGALDRAHTQGLVHRDVKPANILLSRDGDVLLTDFGIARQAAGSSDLTGTGVMIGTLNYASPEQLSAQPLDGRSDQYSLACTIFHVLTGDAPFADTNPVVVVTRHATATPPSVRTARPHVHPDVDAVLARAMAKRPADRFASSSEFATALGAALRATPAEPPDDPQAAIATVLAGQPVPALDGSAAASPTVVSAAGAALPPSQRGGDGGPRSMWAAVGTVAAVVAVVAAVTAFVLHASGPDEVGPTDAARALARISVTPQSPDLSAEPTGKRWSAEGWALPIGGTDKVVFYNGTRKLDILDVESGALLHSVGVGYISYAECVFTASGRYAGCRTESGDSAAGTRDVNSDSYATLLIDTQTGVISGRLPAATEIVSAGETFATFEPERKGAATGSVIAADVTGTVLWRADDIQAGLVHGSGVLSLRKNPVSGDPFSKADFELRTIETGKVVYHMAPDHVQPHTVWAPDWLAYSGGFAVGADFFALDGTKRASAGPGWRVVASQPYATQGDDPAPNGNAKRYAEPDTAPALPVMTNRDVFAAFDPATGTMLWSRKLPKEASYGHGVSVAGIGSKILIRWDTTTTSGSDYLENRYQLAYAWFDAYTAAGGVLPDNQVPWATDGTRVVTVARGGQGGITVVAAGKNQQPVWSLDFGSSPIRTFAGRVYLAHSRIV
ncbi:Serine/threonine-protein kinase PknF [Nocardia cerradoensis]|uniref:non-specific serine/threonine protein kinase n=1 Tax=Nocardia cerradoensis TaxID=85688 RepID=A0A231HAY7_9NOCA|nr:serine/threonine-protein kinase [Nocardia cerradoensis]OXR46094.1 Serine/threonine-protein kinase PknF [Nocardia cerradoensis]